MSFWTRKCRRKYNFYRSSKTSDWKSSFVNKKEGNRWKLFEANALATRVILFNSIEVFKYIPSVYFYREVGLINIFHKNQFFVECIKPWRKTIGPLLVSPNDLPKWNGLNSTEEKTIKNNWLFRKKKKKYEKSHILVTIPSNPALFVKPRSSRYSYRRGKKRTAANTLFAVAKNC